MQIGSTNRVSGLMSGMDTEKMVKDLMDAERAPLDRLKQQMTTVEWQRDMFRELNREIYSLREFSFDMGLTTSYTARNVTSSNPFVVTATASNNAVTTSNSIIVENLATNASLTSGQVSTGANGETIVDGSSVIYQGATPFQLTLQYGAGADQNVKIDVTSGMTVDQFIAAVNGQSQTTGVKASYDPNLKRFFFNQTKSGSEAQITMTANDTAGTSDFITKTLQLATSSATGQDAKVQINGTAFTFATNQFTVNSVNYTLNGVSQIDAMGNPVSSTVNVAQDIDGTVEKIKSFIQAYNDVITKIDGKLSEKREKSYKPLTDAQREQLSEKQEEQWEAKAKSGLLRGDAELTNITYAMRNAIYDTVKGVDNDKYQHLSSIGITVNMYDHKDNKLYIDEDKLRDALQKDPDAVEQLFTNKSDIKSEQGVATRLKNVLDDGFKRLKEKVGSDDVLVDQSFYGERLKEMNERIYMFEERLERKEAFYWQKFTAMEKALSKYNAQAGWLMNQFGGGQ